MRFAYCGKCEELVRRRDLKPCDQHFRDLILSLPMHCMNASCPAPLTVDTFTEHTNSCTCVDEEPELHDVSSLSETAEEDSLPAEDTAYLDDSIASTRSVNSTSSAASTSSKIGRPREEDLIGMKQPAQNNRLRTLKKAVRGYAELMRKILRLCITQCY